jgi:hypothetical protein
MEDNIERIKDELEEARQSLHQTVNEVNRKVEQKVETVSTQLQPAHLVARQPLLWACIAGALGFASGHRDNTPMAVLILGGLLGAALSEAWTDGSCSRDTTASA